MHSPDGHLELSTLVKLPSAETLALESAALSPPTPPLPLRRFRRTLSTAAHDSPADDDATDRAGMVFSAAVTAEEKALRPKRRSSRAWSCTRQTWKSTKSRTVLK